MYDKHTNLSMMSMMDMARIIGTSTNYWYEY